MKIDPSQKLAIRMHFFSILKKVLKIEQKCKYTKHCQLLENSRKYRKIKNLKTISLEREF